MSRLLPAPVHELLTRHVDSFEKLELIYALAEAPHSTLSIDELARALELRRTEVRLIVLELREVSLVHLAAANAVQLRPATANDLAAVDELVTIYREDRFVVVKALAEISLARIRNLASKAFADAFLIGRRRPRKRRDDGG